MKDYSNWTASHGISKAKQAEIKKTLANLNDTRMQIYVGSVHFVDSKKGSFRNFYLNRTDLMPEKLSLYKVSEIYADAIEQLNAELELFNTSDEQRTYINKNLDRILNEHFKSAGINNNVTKYVYLRTISSAFKPVYPVGTKLTTDNEITLR